MPNIYRVNFHSQSYRSSRPANTWAFGADDDTIAGNVVAELANWTVGQQTSLQHELYFNNALPYPVGTRQTYNVLLSDANGGVQRVRIRNMNRGNDEADQNALWLGTASGDIVALSGPPQIVGGGPVTVVVSDPMIQKL